ncbi:MAG TPA: hypothetical protein VIK22_09410 [Candidatus Anoxymicrobiaceae bacterium]
MRYRAGGTVTLPPRSQTTINPSSKVGSKEFSTKITCREGKPIYADRTVSWTGPGASGPEAHSSVGVTTPSKTWYLPEGSRVGRGQVFYCLLLRLS